MTPTASTPTADGPLTTLPLSSTFAVSHLFGGQSLERLRFVWLKRYPSLFFGPASRSVCRGRKRDRLWMHSATIGGAHVSLLMLLILAEQTVLALVTGHLRSPGYSPLSPDHSCVCVNIPFFDATSTVRVVTLATVAHKLFFCCLRDFCLFETTAIDAYFATLYVKLKIYDEETDEIMRDDVKSAKDGIDKWLCWCEGGRVFEPPSDPLYKQRTVRFTDRGPTPKTNCF